MKRGGFLARFRMLRLVAALLPALLWLGWPDSAEAQAVPNIAAAKIQAGGMGAAAGRNARELIIGSISWSIEGRVDRAFVSAAAGLERGKTFASRKELEAYLADRAQRLYNLRLFDEVRIEPVDGGGPGGPGGPSDGGGPGGPGGPGGSSDGGGGPASSEIVDLVVRLRESGTFIVLPGLSQDSSDGLVLDAKLLRYDAEGRGGELDLGLSRAWPPASAAKTAGSVAYSLPFYTGPLVWHGAAAAAPALADDGGASLSSGASLGVDLPLFEGGGPNQVLFVPSIAAAGTWGASATAALSPALALRLGRIDWLVNRRRGYLIEVGVAGNGAGPDASGARLAAGQTIFETRTGATLFSADAAFHALIGAGGELMGRAGALWSPGAADCGLGTAVRGVDAGRLAGDAGLYANFDYWWNLGPFVFSKWFKMDWLSIFDAEVHAGPFVDAGIPRDPSTGGFGLGDGRIGAGIQLQSYALYARPFYIYTSIGVDLRAALAAGTIFGLAADGLPIARLSSAVGLRY
ncbi:MAG TPA: hypothetical protein VMV90_15880 [Rectinemataceae bacterium]|nr:hypothetical protein [Rectinemataceae bacterium]